MSDQLIGITVSQDVDKIKEKLGKLVPGYIDAGSEAASKYLLDVLVNKEIPEWRKVTRTSVYGEPFKTDKQRRFFFAALADGRIEVPYQRRGKSDGIQSNWKIEGSGAEVTLTNDAPAAVYLYDNQKQSLFMGLMGIGWSKIGVILRQYTPQMVRSFMTAGRNYIRNIGLNAR